MGDKAERVAAMPVLGMEKEFKLGVRAVLEQSSHNQGIREAIMKSGRAIAKGNGVDESISLLFSNPRCRPQYHLYLSLRASLPKRGSPAVILCSNAGEARLSPCAFTQHPLRKMNRYAKPWTQRESWH
jgi:hypothetical protein